MRTRVRPCNATEDRVRGGFSLVEVTIALGLAAFGIIAIFALLPTGINSGSDAVRNTVAADLATSIVSDLQAAKSGDVSPLYGLKPDTADPSSPPLYLKADGSKQSSAVSADFCANVNISTNAAKISQVSIVISWPAQATNSVNKFEIVTSLDRSTAP